MGLFDKIKGAFNNTDDFDSDYDNDFGSDDGFGDDGFEEQGYAQPQNTAPAQRTNNRSMGINSGSLEMKVVKPDKYDSQTAQKIADHLLSNRTVVLNLEATNKESARRLIDFLSGVAYSIGGYIQRVAVNTFIIVPENVDISGEQLQEAHKQEDNDIIY